MKRSDSLEKLNNVAVWDVIIIGGGATGLGAAVDAAARGYTTLVLEQEDFAKGTSSRSTKLSHGGVRYLEQGDIKLVWNALRERGLMIKNAPHLVRTLAFIIPAYRWWERYFYGFGMWVYELLSGKRSLGPSRIISRAETILRLPTVKQSGLRGGVLYMDGQFDDARMAISLAQTVTALGGVPLNYAQVTGITRKDGRCSGVTLLDRLNQKSYTLEARCILNATGIFTDTIRQLDDVTAVPMLTVSQGTHIVVGANFLPSGNALMIPKTDDGRVLFAVPWLGHLVIGTTDVPVEHAVLEPRASDEEIQFLLKHASKYLSREIKRSDVLSIFTGIRPLVTRGANNSTSQISRDHTLVVSIAGLVTITGGKWTTYRQMGEEAIDQVEKVIGLEHRPSCTSSLTLYGAPNSEYEADKIQFDALLTEDCSRAKQLHPTLPYREVDVIWAVRNEMACTVEDVLARRTRVLLLNVEAAMAIAPRVAEIMAMELGFDDAWIRNQLSSFTELARGYQVDEIGM